MTLVAPAAIAATGIAIAAATRVPFGRCHGAGTRSSTIAAVVPAEHARAAMGAIAQPAPDHHDDDNGSGQREDGPDLWHFVAFRVPRRTATVRLMS